METLRALPDIQGRKYGTVAVGYDRIDQIRTEVSLLEALAALVCGCTRDELTTQRLQQAITEFQARQSPP
jgi:hypothetical protein